MAYKKIFSKQTTKEEKNLSRNKKNQKDNAAYDMLIADTPFFL